RVGSLLDRPWGPALASLSRWYPELPVEGKSPSRGADGPSRPLRSLADVARATALIGEAGALAQLCFASEGFAIDPVWLQRVDEPDRLHLGDLVRTAIVCTSRGESPELGLRPLDANDLEWAADNLLDERSRPLAWLRDEFLNRAETAGVGERGEALADILSPRLAVELAGLGPREDGKPALTKGAGLVTGQPVGVWLSTAAQ